MQLSVKRKTFYTNHLVILRVLHSYYTLYYILSIYMRNNIRGLLGAYQTIIKDESCELALRSIVSN